MGREVGVKIIMLTNFSPAPPVSNILKTSWFEVSISIMFILHVRKLWLREVKQYAQDLVRGESHDLNLESE